MAGRVPQMRVVFIEQSSQLGGVEVTTLETAAWLDRQRFAPLVVCPEHGELLSRLERARVPVEIIARPRFYSVSARLGRWLVPNPLAILATALSMWRAALRLARFLHARADLVVTKGLLAHFYGGLAAARARVPCVWHVQEVANRAHLGGLYVKALNAAARRWARLIVVDAQSVGAQFAADLRQNGRVRLLYNGLDVDRFSPLGARAALPISSDGGGSPLVIGHVGRVIPLKGQHVLVEAFASLRRRRPDVHLVLAGTPLFDTDHYLRQLEQLVAAYGLDDAVHFLGFRSDVPEILRAIDVFVHPSVEADSPVSVLEAMAVGRAVVASRVPGTVELIDEGVDGCLVPVGDASALADRLAFLLGDRAERERLGASARQTAERRYSRQVFIQGFEAILHEALQG